MLRRLILGRIDQPKPFNVDFSTLTNVFDYLSLRQLLVVRQVSKQFYDLSRSILIRRFLVQAKKATYENLVLDLSQMYWYYQSLQSSFLYGHLGASLASVNPGLKAFSHSGRFCAYFSVVFAYLQYVQPAHQSKVIYVSMYLVTEKKGPFYMLTLRGTRRKVCILACSLWKEKLEDCFLSNKAVRKTLIMQDNVLFRRYYKIPGTTCFEHESTTTCKLCKLKIGCYNAGLHRIVIMP